MSLIIKLNFITDFISIDCEIDSDFFIHILKRILIESFKISINLLF